MRTGAEFNQQLLSGAHALLIPSDKAARNCSMAALLFLQYVVAITAPPPTSQRPQGLWDVSSRTTLSPAGREPVD